MRSNKGFTLIEVLVVVAIIAILASILLVGLGGVRKQGSDARIVADLRSVANALELFANKCGFYPGAASGGVCGATSNPSNWTDLEAQLAGAQIGVDRIPNHPISGMTYFYQLDTTNGGQGYVLKGELADENSRSLNSTWEGTLGSVTCAKANKDYCIRL